jgi:creatinine amidohydrolase
MPKSVMWKELTAADLRDKAQAGAIVLMPVASMEQHGPHLPVGVDTYLSEGLCKATAEAIAVDTPVVVAPTLWCGMAEHHMAFGGTFTLDIPTYRAVLLCLLRSLERHGFKKVLIVNGHGGNMTALNAFLPDIERETGLAVAATTYFELAQPAFAPILEDQQSVLHACEAETSMMMAAFPEAVREAKLPEAHGPHFGDPRAVLAPPAQRFRSFATLSPSGVLGDARKASRAKGERLMDAAADALADIIVSGVPWD